MGYVLDSKLQKQPRFLDYGGYHQYNHQNLPARFFEPESPQIMSDLIHFYCAPFLRGLSQSGRSLQKGALRPK